MRKPVGLKYLLAFIAGMIATASICSCNAKDDDEQEIAVTSSNTAVKNFNLKANFILLANLDSVFFSIDLDHGVIFNADSLPKDTKVTRLVPVITFMNNMSAANLTFTNTGTMNDTTVNYLTNPNDSIDFTYPVKLDVTAADGQNKFTYTIKVNVHKQEPDSLMWDDISTAALPSRFGNPVSQKTVATSQGIACLIEENNGSFTLAQSEKMTGLPEANVAQVDFSFSPQISSFSFSDVFFYILDEEGKLYQSSDAMTWSDTGEKWLSILGPYSGSLLGIKDFSGNILHCHYPQNNAIKDSEVDPDFPVFDSSGLGVFETGWSPLPIGILTGGRTLDGDITGATWGFDGNVWAQISENSHPALSNGTLMRYKGFRNSGNVFNKVELDAWLLFGGVLADGEMNQLMYLSFDNGINWSLASEFMQLPEEIPLLSGADGIVETSVLKANLADVWLRKPAKNVGMWYKPVYTIEGFDINWECPYIYIIGGYTSEGKLSDSLWRAVLSRLEFTPIF